MVGRIVECIGRTGDAFKNCQVEIGLASCAGYADIGCLIEVWSLGWAIFKKGVFLLGILVVSDVVTEVNR